MLKNKKCSSCLYNCNQSNKCKLKKLIKKVKNEYVKENDDIINDEKKAKKMYDKLVNRFQ